MYSLMVHLLLLSILKGSLIYLCSCEECVTFSTGKYIGEKVKTYKGIDYCSFKGIEYATANRFEKSVPVANTNNTYDATKFGPACYQDNTTMMYYLGTTVNMSERCLYLNVYSPDLNGSLPVMVYIHGGAFIAGAPHPYGPDNFMNTRKIVVVTFSYRVSAFGFLYFGDPKYPANIGLHDMKNALRWVQTYISNFGGDPSRVTLDGQSAGSAAIDILANSPSFKGMFVGAIGQSGVTSGRWCLQCKCLGLQRRNMLADNVGCGLYKPLPGFSAVNLVNCLRKKGPDEIIEAIRKFGIQYRPPSFPPIVEDVSVDDPIITYFPWLNNTNSSNLVHRITGVNSNEGATIVADRFVRNLENPLMTMGLYYFAHAYLADLLLYRFLAKNPYDVTEAIQKYYYHLFKTDFKQFLIKVVTDGYMNYPLVRSLKAVRSPTYVYFFNYTLANHTFVGHGGELIYLWPTSEQIIYIQSNKDVESLAETMTKAWIYFAYNQTPMIADKIWEKYDYIKDRVLLIDNTGIKMVDNPSKQENDFWNKLDVDSSPKDKFCSSYTII